MWSIMISKDEDKHKDPNSTNALTAKSILGRRTHHDTFTMNSVPIDLI